MGIETSNPISISTRDELDNVKWEKQPITSLATLKTADFVAVCLQNEISSTKSLLENAFRLKRLPYSSQDVQESKRPSSNTTRSDNPNDPVEYDPPLDMKLVYMKPDEFEKIDPTSPDANLMEDSEHLDPQSEKHDKHSSKDIELISPDAVDIKPSASIAIDAANDKSSDAFEKSRPWSQDARRDEIFTLNRCVDKIHSHLPTQNLIDLSPKWTISGDASRS